MTARTFADFFAGIGLARMGLQMAGWTPLFCNDIDPKKFEMYRANFGREGYRRADIYDVAASQIPDVDLWWGSFPCTDVSLAGSRMGLAGSQSGALMGMLNLLREKDGQRPPLVVLENVPSFVSSHEGADLEETIRQLNGMGYTCDGFVLNAIHFVPQSRPRLFIVGVYDQPRSSGITQKLSSRDPALKSKQLTSFMTIDSGLQWVVLNIPSPPSTAPPLAGLLQRIGRVSERWWSDDRVEYLLNQLSSRHRSVLAALESRRTVSYATAYRRMRNGKSMAEIRADNVAGCLRTPKGGSSRQIVLAVGKGRIRARFMTPREYARLMGAPSYKITVKDNQAYFGFGDAVCVPAVTWIAQHVLDPLMREGSGEGGPQHAATAAT